MARYLSIPTNAFSGKSEAAETILIIQQTMLVKQLVLSLILAILPRRHVILPFIIKIFVRPSFNI